MEITSEEHNDGGSSVTASKNGRKKTRSKPFKYSHCSTIGLVSLQVTLRNEVFHRNSV